MWVSLSFMHSSFFVIKYLTLSLLLNNLNFLLICRFFLTNRSQFFVAASSFHPFFTTAYSRGEKFFANHFVMSVCTSSSMSSYLLYFSMPLASIFAITCPSMVMFSLLVAHLYGRQCNPFDLVIRTLDESQSFSMEPFFLIQNQLYSHRSSIEFSFLHTCWSDVSVPDLRALEFHKYMCNWFRKAIDCVFHIFHSRRFDRVFKYSFHIFFFAVIFEAVYYRFAFDWYGSWIFFRVFITACLFRLSLTCSFSWTFRQSSHQCVFLFPQFLLLFFCLECECLHWSLWRVLRIFCLLWHSSTIFVNASDILFMLTLTPSISNFISVIVFRILRCHPYDLLNLSSYCSSIFRCRGFVFRCGWFKLFFFRSTDINVRFGFFSLFVSFGLHWTETFVFCSSE